MSEVFLNLYQVVAVTVAVLSLVGFIPLSAWLVDLISHFRIQYAALLGLGSFFAVLGGDSYLAILLAGAGLINLWPAIPFLPIKRRQGSAEFHRLVLINVRMRNREFRLTAGFLDEQAPDIIALVEVDEGWLDALGGNLQKRGYHASALPRRDSYGLVIFSKFGILSSEPIEFPALETPSLACMLDISGSSLGLLLIHLPPPLTPQLMRKRDEGLGQVAAWLKGRQGNWMVMGDFNLSPWSRQISRFTEETRFRSFREGRGILATWPDHFAPLRIPLDHVFGGRRIQFGRARLGGSIKSDHLPVVVPFKIEEEWTGQDELPGA